MGTTQAGPLDPPPQLRLRHLPGADEPEPPASTSAESAVDVPAEPILIFADEDGGEGDIQAYCMGGCSQRSVPPSSGPLPILRRRPTPTSREADARAGRTPPHHLAIRTAGRGAILSRSPTRRIGGDAHSPVGRVREGMYPPGLPDEPELPAQAPSGS